MEGIVLWFNKKRGYGFIKPEDKTKDIFIHYTGISGDAKFKELNKSQLVSFELSDNSKGRTAINVKVKSFPDDK